MIRVNALSFSYEEKKPVLEELSFCAQAGRVTGILGPNGSGKSTLFSLLGGLRKPDAGEILIDGKPVGGYSARALSKKLALVPQSSKMEFDFTVFDVVLMGRQPYRRRFLGETAEDAGIARRAMEETGISHLSDRPVTALSGGEWQRVVIARALAQDTPILLFDEPVSNLDIRHQLTVLEILQKKASEGHTVLCVLHDLNYAAHYCDELLLLQKGKTAAFGSPEAVLEKAGEVYGAPLVKGCHPKTGELFLAPDYGAIQ